MRSVDLAQANANEYESMLEVFLGAHFRQIDEFLEKILETATDEQKPIIEKFIVNMKIGQMLTKDACLSMADNLHSKWGEAAFGEYKAQESAREANELLEYRLREHSPANPKVRRKVLELTNGACAYCNQPLGSDFHIEHVVCKSAGGPDHISNYVPACQPCNSKKATLHVLEFIKRYGGSQ